MYVGCEEDVSIAIVFSREHSIEFVVSGGRHSSSGASSTTGGMVIDLAEMRHVRVDVNKQTVHVEGGAIWKDVDEAAAEFGLATVGGTVNHTGVGGLTLGGGYGWLSGRYGLTIDNLLQVRMVLGDGSIKTASQDENPDLFWAARGAGQSFGIAVEFVFQAYEQKSQIWAGQMIFPAERLEAVVAFANKLAATTDGDSGMVMGITAPPFVAGPAVVSTVFYNGSKEEAEFRFKPLLDLKPLRNTTASRPYCEMNAIMNHAVGYGGRKLSKGASFLTPISPTFVRSTMEDLQLFHQRIPNTKKTILLFEFFHPDTWCKISSEATAFANRGRHQNVMIGPFWEDEEHDTDCRLWARQMAKKFRRELEREQTQRGSHKQIGEYGNYDGNYFLLTSIIQYLTDNAVLALSADPRDIFGANLERLRRIKSHYDPDNIFDKSYNLAPITNS